MADLTYCPRCGELFVKALRPICNNCKIELDQNFDIVYRFIRKKENRMATVKEITKKTGVSEEDLYRFIKEGRLNPARFTGLTYPCESCGKQIREGRLCASCSNHIQKEIETVNELASRQKRLKERESQKYRAYETLDEKIKKADKTE